MESGKIFKPDTPIYNNDITWENKCLTFVINEIFYIPDGFGKDRQNYDNIYNSYKPFLCKEKQLETVTM